MRRGKHESIQVRRVMITTASASGTPVSPIARTVAADEDTVRDVIRAFNEQGLTCLDPKRAEAVPA
ncbi:helix-turn-helix domain containing protein [Spirillospora sp. NBC_00431]